jgi:hypothetical protein
VSAFCSKKFYLIIFFSYCLLLINSPLVNANELAAINEQEKPFLTWLPLLSSSLKRLQADIHCPQNYLTDIQVVKEKDKIKSTIAAVHWDLECPAANTKKTPSISPLTLTLDKSQSDAQLAQLLKFLQRLPDSEIVIKSLNIQSAVLKKKLAFEMHLSKSKQAVLIRLANKALQLTVNVDLLNKSFHLKTELKSEKVIEYIKLPKAYSGLIKGPVTFSYASDLNKWELAQFVITSSAEMPSVAEKVALNIAGEINLLTKQVSLQKMDLGLSKINYALTDKAVLKVPFLKLTLPQPASIDLANELNIKTLPVQLRIGGSAMHTKVERAINKSVRTTTQKFPALFANIDIHGKANNLHMGWSLSLLNTSLSGHLKYHAKVLTANIKKGQLTVATLIDGLQGYLPAVQDWSVAKGLINYQLNAKYNLQTKNGYVKSSLQGLNIAGQKGNILFDGLLFNSDTELEIKNAALNIKQGRQQLTLSNLFVGIPIQALKIDAHSRAGITVIDNLNALLLGGKITLQELTMLPQSRSSIELSGLRLSEIVKYSAYPGIAVNGLLDGVLPFTLTSRGVSIEQGVISARTPGGYIKVPQDDTVKKMSSTHPALAFTLRLLSNFQFDTLQGRIGYTADGEMDLNAEIHGLSPDVSGVQPVKFKYSHRENILKLLESLRFSDELTRQIQERY